MSGSTDRPAIPTSCRSIYAAVGHSLGASKRLPPECHPEVSRVISLKPPATAPSSRAAAIISFGAQAEPKKQRDDRHRYMGASREEMQKQCELEQICLQNLSGLNDSRLLASKNYHCECCHLGLRQRQAPLSTSGLLVMRHRPHLIWHRRPDLALVVRWWGLGDYRVDRPGNRRVSRTGDL